MTKVIVGVAIFALMAVLTAMFIYPFIFTTVQGLFENNDLGSILGLAACVIVTIPLIWLTIGLVIGATIALGVREDTVRLNRERKRLRERNARR